MAQSKSTAVLPHLCPTEPPGLEVSRTRQRGSVSGFRPQPGRSESSCLRGPAGSSISYPAGAALAAQNPFGKLEQRPQRQSLAILSSPVPRLLQWVGGMQGDRGVPAGRQAQGLLQASQRKKNAITMGLRESLLFSSTFHDSQLPKTSVQTVHLDKQHRILAAPGWRAAPPALHLSSHRVCGFLECPQPQQLMRQNGARFAFISEVG